MPRDYSEWPSHIPGAVFWRSGSAATPARVLPDGCMDLLWTGGQLFIAGPDTTAHLTRLGADGCVGLRLPPGMMPRVLGLPAHALTDEQPPAEALLPGGVVDRLGDALHSAGPAALEHFAVARLRARPRQEWIRPTVAALGAGVSVQQAASRIGFSDRQFRRLSLDAFGYGPKHLGRVLRFARALELARSGLVGADAAAASGYADQPHLARDVRALAGVPLRQLLSADG